jgi:hypothetical protein
MDSHNALDNGRGIYPDGAHNPIIRNFARANMVKPLFVPGGGDA